MNRMFRRACGALLSCVCVIWHGRLEAADSKTCQPYIYGVGKLPQNISISTGYTRWYVGYAVTGAWTSESRAHFVDCAKMHEGDDKKVCGIPTLGSNRTTQGSTFVKRCLYPYDYNFTVANGTGTAIPWSCMVVSGDNKIIYASTPKMFKDYGCKSGTVGGSGVDCLYTLSPSGGETITFYPNGQGSGGSGGGTQTGVTISGMLVPYLQYTKSGACFNDGYWAYMAHLTSTPPADGTSFHLYAHPSKLSQSNTVTSLEGTLLQIYNACGIADDFYMEDTNHILASGTTTSVGTTDVGGIMGCRYCPKDASDLANKSTLFGSNTPTLYIKDQANLTSETSCKLNYAVGKDPNNKGTVKYTSCTNYK